MSDYIKREEAEQVLTDFINKSENPITLNDVVNLLGEIYGLPAADVRENVRGEWERVEGFTGVEAFGFKETTVEGWSCSICDFEIDVSEKSFNYCPNCGTDMKGAKQ